MVPGSRNHQLERESSYRDAHLEVRSAESVGIRADYVAIFVSRKCRLVSESIRAYCCVKLTARCIPQHERIREQIRLLAYRLQVRRYLLTVEKDERTAFDIDHCQQSG